VQGQVTRTPRNMLADRTATKKKWSYYLYVIYTGGSIDHPLSLMYQLRYPPDVCCERLQSPECQVQQLCERLQSLECQVRQLEEDNQILKCQVRQLEKDNQILKCRVRQLEEDNQSLESRIDECEQQGAFLVAQVDRLHYLQDRNQDLEAHHAWYSNGSDS
jgi:TolA-binding protein